MSGPLAVDLQQIVSQAIAFVVLVVVLKKVAWKPVLALLDERRHRIENDLKQAADAKTEMARLQQEYAQRLAVIDEEARRKIQEAVQEGRRIAGEVQEQARAQAQEILAKSQQTITLELAKAKVTLRDALADMTVQAAERMLRQRLDPEKDRQLITAILQELESEQAAR
jgi:F-type H+-transporting ATPase subunit b